MNANELADWLENWFPTSDDEWYDEEQFEMQKIVSMLRQQQAEIEVLKQRLFEMQNANIDLVKQFKGYAQQPNQDQIPEWWRIELRKAQEK